MKIINAPRPLTRQDYGRRDAWTGQALARIEQVKPETQALVVITDDSKREIKRWHSLAVRYGFRVTCRRNKDGDLLVWKRAS